MSDDRTLKNDRAGAAATDGASADLGLRAESVALQTNIYTVAFPWATATGFRTHGMRFSNLGAQRRSIGEEFLLSTRYRHGDRETQASIQEYFTDPGVVMLSRNGEEDTAGNTLLPLPAGVRLRMELGEAAGFRRSVRTYTGDALSFDQVATLVRIASGITATNHTNLAEGGERQIYLRTTPSGGGLYPLELWLLPKRVTDLPGNVWRYSPRHDALIEEGDESMLNAAIAAFSIPEEVVTLSKAALVFLIVGRPWKAIRKYGDRGVRFLFFEAGAIAENVHLACRSLGVGSVDCASVYDDDMHAALDFDGEMRTLIHAIVLGVPS